MRTRKPHVRMFSRLFMSIHDKVDTNGNFVVTWPWHARRFTCFSTVRQLTEACGVECMFRNKQTKGKRIRDFLCVSFFELLFTHSLSYYSLTLRLTERNQEEFKLYSRTLWLLLVDLQSFVQRSELFVRRHLCPSLQAFSHLGFRKAS